MQPNYAHLGGVLSQQEPWPLQLPRRPLPSQQPQRDTVTDRVRAVRELPPCFQQLFNFRCDVPHKAALHHSAATRAWGRQGASSLVVNNGSGPAKWVPWGAMGWPPEPQDRSPSPTCDNMLISALLSACWSPCPGISMPSSRRCSPGCLERPTTRCARGLCIAPATAL